MRALIIFLLNLFGLFLRSLNCFLFIFVLLGSRSRFLLRLSNFNLFSLFGFFLLLLCFFYNLRSSRFLILLFIFVLLRSLLILLLFSFLRFLNRLRSFSSRSLSSNWLLLLGRILRSLLFLLINLLSHFISQSIYKIICKNRCFVLIIIIWMYWFYLSYL